jgi:putative hemolysin
MAVAVDEHGGTAGIITLEQLLEEMVGPLGDELKPPDSEVQAIDDRTIQVEGSLSVEEARDELGIDIPEGPYDTIAGFILERLGHIPEEGEDLDLDESNRITIIEMKGPKIESVRLTKA